MPPPRHVTRAQPPPPTIPHQPVLDGLRGVAVALVVVYHLAPEALPGGFLGVDVFFVLSGFLITSLALVEVGRTGRFDVGAFFLRRARRLLPALLLLLAAVAGYGAWWAAPNELQRLREHSFWTLGYLANWRFIADGTTYTDLLYGQSPLRHTWSLAIEEQFYVAFPLLVLVVGSAARWRPRYARRLLGIVATTGAIASAAWMAVRWSPDDPSRGYFGTDTRLHTILIGVLLGVLLLGRPPDRRRSDRPARLAAAAAALGAVGLGVGAGTVSEDSAALQHGGFLLVAVATAGVIAGAEKVAPLRWLLTLRPLVALGAISYGVYLWHWPVIIALDEARTGLDGAGLLVLRLAITLVAAVVSAALIERPARALAVPAAGWRRLRALGSTSAVMAGVAALVAVATVVPVSAPAPIAPREQAPVSNTLEPVGMIMFGDSVAHTLAGGSIDGGFVPWAPDQSSFDPAKVELTSMARVSCSYLPGGLIFPGGVQGDISKLCGNWQLQLDDLLGKTGAEVVLVGLANDAGHRELDGKFVELGSSDHQELVDGFLDEMRAIARSHRAELVLLAMPPRTDALRTTELDIGGERERRMRTELTRYAANRPGVRVLDLFEQVCPNGDCDAPRSGFDPAWRSDGLHFDPAGARWVADWITAQLLA